MTHLLIAGRGDDIRYSEIERLADILQYSLPLCTVEKQLVHPSQWEMIVTSICERYGFLHDKKEPLVWMRTGEYIGDHNRFREWVHKKFGLELDVSQDVLREFAVENKAYSEWLASQEEARARKAVLTLVVVGLQTEFSRNGSSAVKGVNESTIERLNWIRRFVQWEKCYFLLLPSPTIPSLVSPIHPYIDTLPSDEHIDFHTVADLPEVPQTNEICLCGHAADGCLGEIAEFYRSQGRTVVILENITGYNDLQEKNEIKSKLSKSGVVFMTTKDLPHTEEIIQLG